MCLAVPGKIIRIQDSIATVDYDIEKRQARIIEKNFKVGDYIIVQGGIAVQKIDSKEAQEALKLYKQNLEE